MKLRLNIDHSDGTTWCSDDASLDELRDAGDLLKAIAFEGDPNARHRPTSASTVTRVDLTWEA